MLGGLRGRGHLLLGQHKFWRHAGLDITIVIRNVTAAIPVDMADDTWKIFIAGLVASNDAHAPGQLWADSLLSRRRLRLPASCSCAVSSSTSTGGTVSEGTAHGLSGAAGRCWCEHARGRENRRVLQF